MTLGAALVTLALGAISVVETAVGTGRDRGSPSATAIIDPTTDPLYLGLAGANLVASIVGYSLLGVVVGRAGRGPRRAAMLAAASLMVAMIGSVFVEELLFPNTAYFFFPPMGFSLDYLVAFGVLLNAVIFVPAAALLSAGCAWIARRRA